MCANILVMGLLCRTHILRQKHNIFIAHLSVADFLVGLGLVFWAARSLAPPKDDGPKYSYTNVYPLCAASLSVSMTSLVASVLCLIVISVERYVKVIHPLRHMVLLTPCALRGLRMSTWGLAVICGIVVFFTARWDHGRCRSDAHTIFVLILFSLGLVLLSFLHGNVLRVTFRQRRLIRDICNHVTGQRQRHLGDVKLAVMVGLLFGLLYICWLPSLILSAIQLIDNSENNTLRTTGRVTLMMRYFSTTLNPIIFNTFNADFKTAVRTRIPCICPSKKADVEMISTGQLETIHVCSPCMI